MSGLPEPESAALPRLLVAKGSFAKMGGAERDLLRNLPALEKVFSVKVATLHPVPELVELCQKLNFQLFSPKKNWIVPTNSWSIVFDRSKNSAKDAWKSCNGLMEEIENTDGIHIVSGDGSLALLDLIPDHVSTHLHLLEPHRGLHEDVLHRDINGRPKRNLKLTKLALSYARNRDVSTIRKLAKRKRSAISANSNFTSSRIAEIYQVNSNVLWPSVDISEFPPVAGSDEPESFDEVSKPYAVNIGRASWVKGTLQAIQAVSRTGIGLVHIGGASEEDAKIMRDYAENKTVKLWIAPRLSSPELAGLIRGADAVISLAINEPFGLTPIEAFSIGTPAIFVDEGGFKDTIENHVSGQLVPRSSDSSWYDLLTNLNAEQKNAWTKAGRTKIAELDLTQEAHARRIKESFDLLNEVE
jgi:glycosyltransferase involved in cell wall biosynthesis